MTITVDINVLLDVVQKREPHYAASARVVSLVTSGQLTGVIPSHAMTTLYQLARKHASKPYAKAAMDRVLAALRIGNLDHAAWEEARTLAMTDFEDAAVAMVAKTPDCQTRWLASDRGNKAQSKWKTSRSDALTGLWSGFDGMISTFCFHHF